MQPQEPRYDRNNYIKPGEVRVIDENGENLGVLKTQDALSMARSKELDLVLINPKSEPPIARIISWSKFKYDMSKKKKGAKAAEQKEMWFKPNIDRGDMMHKVKKVEDFLDKGHKVKISLRSIRGTTRDKMQDTMTEILEALAENAEPESPPKFEGRNMGVIVKAKK